MTRSFSLVGEETESKTCKGLRQKEARLGLEPLSLQLQSYCPFFLPQGLRSQAAFLITGVLPMSCVTQDTLQLELFMP